MALLLNVFSLPQVAFSLVVQVAHDLGNPHMMLGGGGCRLWLLVHNLAGWRTAFLPGTMTKPLLINNLTKYFIRRK